MMIEFKEYYYWTSIIIQKVLVLSEIVFKVGVIYYCRMYHYLKLFCLLQILKLYCLLQIYFKLFITLLILVFLTCSNSNKNNLYERLYCLLSYFMILYIFFFSDINKSILMNIIIIFFSFFKSFDYECM